MVAGEQEGWVVGGGLVPVCAYGHTLTESHTYVTHSHTGTYALAPNEYSPYARTHTRTHTHTHTQKLESRIDTHTHTQTHIYVRTAEAIGEGIGVSQTDRAEHCTSGSL